jgi:hypothetical protein
MGSLDSQQPQQVGPTTARRRSVFMNVSFLIFHITDLWYVLHIFSNATTNTDRIDPVRRATSSIGRAHA